MNGASVKGGAAGGSGYGLVGMRELTSRELEVLRLIAAGGTNREIAQRLLVSSQA
jgi:DNA-binding NarL/FixJ family response regulator